MAHQQLEGERAVKVYGRTESGQWIEAAIQVRNTFDVAPYRDALSETYGQPMSVFVTDDVEPDPRAGELLAEPPPLVPPPPPPLSAKAALRRLVLAIAAPTSTLATIRAEAQGIVNDFVE
jgi:hypothetical protein